MTTLMVHLQAGASNGNTLSVAGELARKMDARVFGVAACQPMQIVFSDGFYYSGELIEQDRRALEKELETAKEEFFEAMKDGLEIAGWRASITLTPLAAYVAHQARGADLLVSAVDGNRKSFDSSRHVDISDLVMHTGRPILLVPSDLDRLELRHALVCWNDSREIRRTALDALPLLKRAEKVTLVELAADADREAAEKRLEDVAGWLSGHGITTQAVVELSAADNAGTLAAIAQQRDVDLMVAGAYGHSRLREWILGGVTQELLLRAQRCTVTSR